jgi:hypothetical protein
MAVGALSACGRIGYQLQAGDGGNLPGTDGSPYQDGAVSGDRPGMSDWLDPAYLFRRAISIDTQNAVSAGYSVLLTFDHQSLVLRGVARSDGADLRIVRHEAGGAVEIARTRDPDSGWNDSSTRLWFPLAESLSPNTTLTGRYYLYYGSGATGPRQDWSEVFLVGDEFNDGVLHPELQVAVNGTGDVSENGGNAEVTVGNSDSDATIVRWAQNVDVNAGISIRLVATLASAGATGGTEAKTIGLVQSASAATPATGTIENSRRLFYALQTRDGEMELTYWNSSDEQRSWNGSSWQSGRVGWRSGVPLGTAFQYELKSANGFFSLEVRDETGVSQTSTTPVAWSEVRDLGDPCWFYFGEIYTDFYRQVRQQVDWLAIRPHVSPEPTTQLGDEQSLP